MGPSNARELDLFQNSRQFLSTGHFHYLRHTHGGGGGGHKLKLQEQHETQAEDAGMICST